MPTASTCCWSGRCSTATATSSATRCSNSRRWTAPGRFPASRDDVAKSGFTGFARVGTGTDAQHRFVVETVKPGRIAADEAPHINVTVMMRGILTHAFTRVYFDDEAAANATDPVLNLVPAERRATLVAKRDAQPGRPVVYRFDVRMQGPDETVFFDV